MAKSVQDQMDEILADFVNEEQDVIEGCFVTVGQATVKRLKEISPKSAGGGDYARSWTLQKQSKKSRGITFGKTGVTVYNKKHYRLTHLLEKSHRIKNQYGEYGRSEPKPHIGKAEEWGVNELMKELENKL